MTTKETITLNNVSDVQLPGIMFRYIRNDCSGVFGIRAQLRRNMHSFVLETGIYENLLWILVNQIPIIIVTQTIKITEIIMLEVTTATTPLTAIPIAITNIGFPEALAYPSLSFVLLNTFPCIDE